MPNREQQPQNNNGVYPPLNFPPFGLRIAKRNGRNEIFDPVRKRYVALTPEEWVRQHVIAYLHCCKHYPLELMKVEGSINIGGLSRRCDVVVYSTALEPILLVECKQPMVELSQKTFDQAARYNLVLNVPYLFITNGLTHCCYSIDKNKQEIIYHPDLPERTALGLNSVSLADYESPKSGK